MSNLSFSRRGSCFLSLLIPTMHSETRTSMCSQTRLHPPAAHTFLFDRWARHMKENIAFSTEAGVSFEIEFSFSSPLPFFVLSYTLHHCLRKSLTQLGLPPVSDEEIQGLPEEQSQDQRPAAPSFRVKAYHPPPSFFLPSHLISFLRQGVRM